MITEALWLTTIVLTMGNFFINFWTAGEDESRWMAGIFAAVAGLLMILTAALVQFDGGSVRYGTILLLSYNIVALPIFLYLAGVFSFMGSLFSSLTRVRESLETLFDRPTCPRCGGVIEDKNRMIVDGKPAHLWCGVETNGKEKRRRKMPARER